MSKKEKAAHTLERKKEKAAHTLERKILRAIERGEFTPAYGYLMFPRLAKYVPLGPCGCLLAAAASVCGLQVGGGQEALIAYLGQHGVKRRDALLLEAGYEGVAYEDVAYEDLTDEFEDFAGCTDARNPYYQVGQRLRRFHPYKDGYAQ